MPIDVCRNCGGSVFHPLWRAPAFDHDRNDDFPVARCDQCGLVNTLSVSDDRLKAAYDESYYGSGSQKFTGLLEKALSLFTRLRARRMVSRFDRPASALDALDIGCGRGLLLQSLAAEGVNICGIERESFPDRPDFVHIGALSDETFNGRQFDIVIIWHVLEHLDQLSGTLDEVTAHMKPGGLLFIAVPNFQSLQQALFTKDWFHLDLPRHLTHLEPDWLKDALEARGFALEQNSYHDVVQNLYGFIQSTLNKLMPRTRNLFYEQLKFSRRPLDASFVLSFILAVLIMPLALIEYVISSLISRGATVTCTLRYLPK